MKKFFLVAFVLIVILVVFYYFSRQKAQQQWFKIVEQSGMIALDRPTVILDPGHGGKDAGAEAGGLKEKDLTLDLAKRVKTILENAGYNVVLTREGDQFLQLEDRAAFAYKYKAALFVSIHLNSFFFPTRGGSEVLYDKDGALAQKISEGLKNELKKFGVSRAKIEKQEMFVLTHFPGADALVEPAYLSNKKEADLLRTEKFKTAIAEGIGAGVLTFKKPSTVAIAPTTTPPSNSSQPEILNPLPVTLKKITLTFNIDAKHSLNPRILNVLENQNVKALFFLSGQWAAKHEVLVKRISANHQIGNYSWSGPRLSLMREQEIAGQFERTEKLIQKIAAVSTKPYLRLPYEENEGKVNKVILESGYEKMRADIEATNFWNRLFPGQLKNKVLEQSRDGSILSLDGSAPDLLDEEITKLKILGFKFE